MQTKPTSCRDCAVQCSLIPAPPLKASVLSSSTPDTETETETETDTDSSSGFIPYVRETNFDKYVYNTSNFMYILL